MKIDNYMQPHKCPVCGKYEFEQHASYDICPVCGWEDDDYQIIYPDETGANDVSLIEAREKWKSRKSFK